AFWQPKCPPLLRRSNRLPDGRAPTVPQSPAPCPSAYLSNNRLWRPQFVVPIRESSFWNLANTIGHGPNVKRSHKSVVQLAFSVGREPARCYPRPIKLYHF